MINWIDRFFHDFRRNENDTEVVFVILLNQRGLGIIPMIFGWPCNCFGVRQTKNWQKLTLSFYHIIFFHITRKFTVLILYTVYLKAQQSVIVKRFKCITAQTHRGLKQNPCLNFLIELQWITKTDHTIPIPIIQYRYRSVIPILWILILMNPFRALKNDRKTQKFSKLDNVRFSRQIPG